MHDSAPIDAAQIGSRDPEKADILRQEVSGRCLKNGKHAGKRQAQRGKHDERTPIAQQCLKARVDPVHVTAMVLFLASDDAAMCTAHNYWVDAGYR